MKSLFAVALAALFLSTLPAASECADQQQLAFARAVRIDASGKVLRDKNNNILRDRNGLPKTESSTGSGTILTMDTVLTAFHVIEKQTSYTVTLADGQTTWPLKLIAVDPAHDLALLKLARTDVSLDYPVAPLRVGLIAPSVGENFHVWSLNQDRWLRAEVLNWQPGITREAYPYIYHTQLVGLVGDSGSGVFSCSGALIGVIAIKFPRESIDKATETRKAEVDRLDNIARAKFAGTITGIRNFSLLSQVFASGMVSPEYIGRFVCKVNPTLFGNCWQALWLERNDRSSNASTTAP